MRRVSIPLGMRCAVRHQRRLFWTTEKDKGANADTNEDLKKASGEGVRYAQLRDRYDSPRHPLVLAHGLLGFAELRLGGLLGISYWRGIREALVENAVKGALSESSPQKTPPVIACTVPPSASIAERARHLAADISRQLSAGETDVTVNIIAHSMGGLDARYLISRLRPKGIRVASLTTIATPHRGSCIADLFLEDGGQEDAPRLRALVVRALAAAGLEPDAFAQLSRPYLAQFNPTVPDDPDTRYFSFGASMEPDVQLSWPFLWSRPFSPFRLPWRALLRSEGPNDGLVSVASARWGEDCGTLEGVSHLDLINWTGGRRFNAVALYLDIADMLAKEGL